jgi:hypothetical protein
MRRIQIVNNWRMDLGCFTAILTHRHLNFPLYCGTPRHLLCINVLIIEKHSFNT